MSEFKNNVRDFLDMPNLEYAIESAVYGDELKRRIKSISNHYGKKVTLVEIIETFPTCLPYEVTSFDLRGLTETLNFLTKELGDIARMEVLRNYFANNDIKYTPKPMPETLEEAEARFEEDGVL